MYTGVSRSQPLRSRAAARSRAVARSRAAGRCPHIPMRAFPGRRADVTVSGVWSDPAGMPPFLRGGVDLTDAQVRRAVRAGDLVAMRRGVLVGRRRVELATSPRDAHALAVQVALAGITGPAAYACLGSAALLHGFSRLGRSPERVRLYRARGGAWRDEEVAVLVCGLPDDHVGQVEGVPTTTPARTVVDLARWTTFRSGVVVADSALRLGCARGEWNQSPGVACVGRASARPGRSSHLRMVEPSRLWRASVASSSPKWVSPLRSRKARSVIHGGRSRSWIFCGRNSASLAKPTACSSTTYPTEPAVRSGRPR